jgi:hypothetical protein
VEANDDVTHRPKTHGGEMDEREIDANLEDTFPASDPPSWTVGTDHSANPQTPINDESTNTNEEL